MNSSSLYRRQTPPALSYDAARNRGFYPWIVGDVKFGFNPAVSGLEDIWSVGGTRNTPTGSFTPFIASDNAGDTAIITVIYLDQSGKLRSKDVTLTGTTPVSLGAVATESTRGFISSASPSALSGTVTLATANNFTAGVPNDMNQVLWDIEAEYGQTLVAADRVPAGHEIIITEVQASITRVAAQAASARLALQIRPPGGQWRSPFVFELTTYSSRLGHPIVRLPAGWDIKARAISVSLELACDFSWVYERIEL